MTLRWLSVEQSTGRVIADLPDLTLTSLLKKTLGRYETATANLPIPTAPDDWQRATREGYAALLAFEDDDVETPLWGGLVTRQERGFDDAGARVVVLSLMTAEGYLDGRIMGDWTYTATEQCEMAGDIVDRFASPDGLPFEIDYQAGATLRDRTYRDMDDMTVYTALQNLMGVIDGPEWTVNWKHLTSPERYVPVFYVRDQITTPYPVGPSAHFAMPGSVTAAKTVADYGRGKGANDVMAVGTSQLDSRPQSAHHTFTGDGRPKVEYRYIPSSSITDPAVLDAHAGRALPALQDGQKSLTLTAQRRDAQGWLAPRLGEDWLLGDDISYEVVDPLWPDGLTGVDRCIGWQLDEQTVAPILAIDTVEAAA